MFIREKLIFLGYLNLTLASIMLTYNQLLLTSVQEMMSEDGILSRASHILFSIRFCFFGEGDLFLNDKTKL